MSTAPDPRTDQACSGPMDMPPLPPRGARRFARVTRLENAPDRGEQVEIRDGRKLWLRPIEGTDMDGIQRCFTRLSDDEIRMRFMYHMRELPMPMARNLCHIDTELEAANVLIDDTVHPAEIRGVGRIYHDLTCNQAEFAVLVEKAWTGFGLGAVLMQRLVDECRRRKIERLWGYVLIENRPMLDLCRRLGFKRHAVGDDLGTALIALDLGD